MHKDGFKGVGSLEDDLYTGMSEDSSVFLNEARNMWNTDEDMTSKPISEFTVGVVGFFSKFLMIQPG